jgi:hypothetical protein
MLYAGSNLGRAQEIFTAAIKHRPHIANHPAADARVGPMAITAPRTSSLTIAATPNAPTSHVSLKEAVQAALVWSPGGRRAVGDRT